MMNKSGKLFLEQLIFSASLGYTLNIGKKFVILPQNTDILNTFNEVSEQNAALLAGGICLNAKETICDERLHTFSRTEKMCNNGIGARKLR
jgi:hypothetical protein